MFLSEILSFNFFYLKKRTESKSETFLLGCSAWLGSIFFYYRTLFSFGNEPHKRNWKNHSDENDWPKRVFNFPKIYQCLRCGKDSFIFNVVFELKEKKPVVIKILNLIKYNDPTKRFKICHQLFFYVYCQELFFFFANLGKIMQSWKLEW